MKPYREIKFTTTRSRNGLTAGKTCYQGHLQHNAVLSEKETRRRFADCCNQEPFETNKYIDALGTFIAREIAHGNRLNFGAFGVGLHMGGGFRGANAPFDEKRNAISVCLIPGKEIKASVKALKPINVTEDTRWYLSGTLQRVPCEVYDELGALPYRLHAGRFARARRLLDRHPVPLPGRAGPHPLPPPHQGRVGVAW